MDQRKAVSPAAIPLNTQGGVAFGHFTVGSNSWTVSRLIALSKDLPVFDMPICGLDLTGTNVAVADIVSLAEHAKRVQDADLSYPIILDYRGRLMDGYHRIAKALILCRTTIRTVRFTEYVAPCRTDADE